MPKKIGAMSTCFVFVLVFSSTVPKVPCFPTAKRACGGYLKKKRMKERMNEKGVFSGGGKKNPEIDGRKDQRTYPGKKKKHTPLGIYDFLAPSSQNKNWVFFFHLTLENWGFFFLLYYSYPLSTRANTYYTKQP